VVKSKKSNKCGSVARIPSKGDDYYTISKIYQTFETHSDEKNSCHTLAISSSEKESKEQQSSSHSRKTLSSRKHRSIYGNIENLRNIQKAEKELRGIFYSVKQYEFPIIKDAEGNIKIIGKY
jgi:hypothetical protein